MRKRTQFAAPFVMVVATACSGGSARPPHKNPPPPKDPTAVACDQHKEGDACQTGYSCQIEAKGGCGPSGFTCTDGKWVKVMATCNPPPPEEKPAP